MKASTYLKMKINESTQDFWILSKHSVKSQTHAHADSISQVIVLPLFLLYLFHASQPPLVGLLSYPNWSCHTAKESEWAPGCFLFSMSHCWKPNAGVILLRKHLGDDLSLNTSFFLMQLTAGIYCARAGQ